VLMAAWWGRRQGSVADVAEAHFDSKETKAALWEAKWELLIPVVALVAIFGGFASIVQASALTAFYAFFVEVFIYRDLKIKKDLPRVMAECGLLVGGVLLIIGVAQGFNNYLITEEAPQRLLAWVQTTVRSPLVFLLMLNVFLLIVGCVMDLYSAIIVIVPMMVPIGLAFGIDPVHLGIVFMANLQLGYLTPPVGMNLFLAAYRFDKPLPEIYRAVIPMLIALTTFLPDLILGSGD
jgi:C4-dicarboxylate transporter DctM subunit